MRIVHTCLRYPPAVGGVETYVQQIVERTRNINEGQDIRVLTSKMRTHGPVSMLSPDLLLDDPPYVQRLHQAKTPLISYPRLQALPYYLAHHQPDIVEAYSFWYQPADVAARYARTRGIPFIFHPIFYENEVRKKAIWQIYKNTYGRGTFAAADVVVVISPQERKLIEKSNLPVRRYVLIPPGVDVQALKRQAGEATRQEDKQRIILTVSRLASGKGLDEIISVMPEIIRAVPEARLVIVGEDFGERSKLEKLIQKHGLDQYVQLAGKLDQQELINVYKNATLFVHPSYYEAFGIVLAEALAAGTPVVARNMGSVPFVAPHEKAGLLFGSRTDMAEQIIKLLQNDGYRRELAEWGQKYVTENFSWDKSIKKLVAVYEEMTKCNQTKSIR